MAKFSAKKIAAAINTTPTDEQISIIESALEPAVVIAGAGSGKTETMANRVLYLIVNELAKPDEILGLTFTRKAAGELKARIRKRLRQLIDANLLPHGFNIDVPVMTYHAYAGYLLAEYGLRIGIDGEAELVGDANLWQQANNLIRNWPEEEFRYTNKISTLIDDVIGLTKNVLEHKIDTKELAEEHKKLLSLLEKLTPGLAKDRDVINTVIKVLAQRIQILPMVEKFIEQRQNSGALAFDDQMSLAADLASNLPQVSEVERAKFRVVLLDEYQDTSQSQVRMLSALFGNNHPVTAVGDPYQAIYGWRGAAIGTIKNFARDFNCKNIEFNLSKTFRNDLAILEIANKLAIKVGEQINFSVKPLTPREGAGKGKVISQVFIDAEQEAEAIAQHLTPIWKGATNAVLVRNRKQIPAIESALHKAGLPVEVIGIGGLMSMPEVLDIFTLLKVIADPDAGGDLMRHLTGPRIKLGAKDLAALGNFKRSRTRKAEKNLVSELATGSIETAEADDLVFGSLIESLDEIESANPDDFTKVGFARLVAFASDLRKLRARAAGSLIDLIYEIEDYLHLSSELEFKEQGVGGRRNIDRFVEEAAKFGSNSITEFIEWLEVAIERERGLEAGTPDVKKDVIQILTIHMAKGAEWDHVVIPGLAEGLFPSENKNRSISWLHSETEIPFSLRGDSAEFNDIDFVGVSDVATAAKRIDEFKSYCQEVRIKEEWRLAYVAITRAKQSLFASFAIWSEHKNADKPSELMELIHNEVIEIPAKGENNPVLQRIESGTWPTPTRFDYSKVLKLFESVEANPFDEDAALLIKQRKITPDQIKLPDRISVSTLVALKSDPAEVIEAIRRPMPFLQDKYMRRGTEFHAWVEKHLKADLLFSDDDLDYQDKLEDDSKLSDLQEKWLASEWASKTPHELEVPFEMVIAGTLVRGRIDAIYKTETGYEVVDWKTGSTKLGKAEEIQLAIYRMAWAQISKTEVSKISAAFHYVPTGVTDRRSDFLSEQELRDLIAAHK